MGQSCTSFRFCFFETSENDGTLEVQENPRQTEKSRIEKSQVGKSRVEKSHKKVRRSERIPQMA